MQIRLVLHNIRSTYNVGAILRTAEGLGIKEVIYSGYTPRYDDPSLLPHLREKLNRQIAKSALGAEKLVPQISLDKAGLAEWLQTASAQKQLIIGLENNLSKTEQSRQLILGRPAELGEEIILILGEEVNGIPAEIRPWLNYFLEIPMCGQKESFNVSVAAGIALWALQNYY